VFLNCVSRCVLVCTRSKSQANWHTHHSVSAVPVSIVAKLKIVVATLGGRPLGVVGNSRVVVLYCLNLFQPEYACVGCRHLSAGAKHVILSRGPCAVTLLSCSCHDGVFSTNLHHEIFFGFFYQFHKRNSPTQTSDPGQCATVPGVLGHPGPPE
jgi:hypothetical protein